MDQSQPIGPQNMGTPMPGMGSYFSVPAPTSSPAAPTTPTSAPSPDLGAFVQAANQMGQKAVTPSANMAVNQVKKGTQLSFTGFLIGCLVFLFLFIGGASLGLYYLLNNPSQLSGIMDLATAKTLINLFAGLFFGVLFFLGFGIVILNGYRLFASREGSKIAQFFRFIFGLLLLGGTIFGGTRTFQAISQIDSGNATISNALIIQNYLTKDGLVTLPEDARLVGPVVLQFALNQSLLQSSLGASIPLSSIQSLSLQCQEGRNLTLDLDTLSFQGSCLYLQKGKTPLSLNVEYRDVVSNQIRSTVLQAGEVSLFSSLTLRPGLGSLEMNSTQSELVIEQPTRVAFDAQSALSDLGIPQNTMRWDFDGNDSIDTTNILKPTYLYTQSQLYRVTFSFEENGDIYSFPLRVGESDTPLCTIEHTLDKTQLSSSLSFQNKEFLNQVKDYRVEIINDADGKTIETVKTKLPKITYTFKKSGTYYLKATYVLDDGKQGTCESDSIEIGELSYELKTNFTYTTPSIKTAQNVASSGVVVISGNTLVIKKLPVNLLLNISAINPTVPLIVKANNNPILPSRNGMYEVSLDSDDIRSLSVFAKESNGEILIREFPVVIDQPKIIGKLSVTPDTTGPDPLEVTLDASQTTLTDKSDEIVSFTRDFGDGEIKRNINQGKVVYTYRFDTIKESGEYTPKVTIRTKKGLQETIVHPTPIIVKRATRTLRIVSDTHPGQLATAGDRIGVRIQTDGAVRQITRDFGDGNPPIECEYRECAETMKAYENPGEYSIKVQVKYDDHPALNSSLKFKVE